jgi:hypothetical protein
VENLQRAVDDAENGASDISSHARNVVTWSAFLGAFTLVGLVVGGAWSILSWQYTENNRLRKELTDLQIAVVKESVTRPELHEIMKELSDRFDKRIDKLEARILDLKK